MRRFVLLVVLPVAAVAGGFTWWLSGGRYISTDNAYVGADKALITPYVTGPIVAIHVKEGQHVEVGDPLFDIDPAPYETALALAKGRLEAAKVEFANLRESYLVEHRPDHDGRGVGQASPGRFRPQEVARSRATPAPAPTRTRPRPRWCRPSRSSNSCARSSRPRK